MEDSQKIKIPPCKIREDLTATRIVTQKNKKAGTEDKLIQYFGEWITITINEQANRIQVEVWHMLEADND